MNRLTYEWIEEKRGGFHYTEPAVKKVVIDIIEGAGAEDTIRALHGMLFHMGWDFRQIPPWMADYAKEIAEEEDNRESMGDEIRALKARIAEYEAVSPNRQGKIR